MTEAELRTAPPLKLASTVPLMETVVPGACAQLPAAVQVPVDGVRVTSVTPAGRGSVTTTFRAVDGPALVTVMIQLTDSPATGWRRQDDGAPDR